MRTDMDEKFGAFKPCPFCGNKVMHLTEKNLFYDAQAKTGYACISVRCYKCKVDMYEHTYDVTGYYKRVEMLREKWNMRASDE